MAKDGEKESKSKLQQTLNGYGGNIQPFMEDLRNDRDRVIELMRERDEKTAQINEIRAGVKAKGIPKKAFDNAISRYEMDPEKRAELDDNYALVCEAFGVPLQSEFKFGEEGENDNASEEETNIGAEQAAAIQSAAAAGNA